MSDASELSAADDEEVSVLEGTLSRAASVMDDDNVEGGGAQGGGGGYPNAVKDNDRDHRNDSDDDLAELLRLERMLMEEGGMHAAADGAHSQNAAEGGQWRDPRGGNRGDAYIADDDDPNQDDDDEDPKRVHSRSDGAALAPPRRQQQQGQAHADKEARGGRPPLHRSRRVLTSRVALGHRRWGSVRPARLGGDDGAGPGRRQSSGRISNGKNDADADTDTDDEAVGESADEDDLLGRGYAAHAQRA
jgi:hypothetical protein